MAVGAAAAFRATAEGAMAAAMYNHVASTAIMMAAMAARTQAIGIAVEKKRKVHNMYS